MTKEVNMNAAIYNNTLIPVVTPFFDAESNTFSYVVKDPSSAACAVIDSVLDLDYASGGISHEGADAIIKFIRDNDLKIEWIVETHAHATIFRQAITFAVKSAVSSLLVNK